MNTSWSHNGLLIFFGKTSFIHIYKYIGKQNIMQVFQKDVRGTEFSGEITGNFLRLVYPNIIYLQHRQLAKRELCNKNNMKKIILVRCIHKILENLIRLYRNESVVDSGKKPSCAFNVT